MKLEAFRTWCAAKSIQTCLEIKESKDGSRYTVLRDDAPTPSSGRSRNLLQVPLEACLTASSSEALADRLAFEKEFEDLSDFKPYLDLLPPSLESFQNLPRFWSMERVESVTDGGQLQLALDKDRPRLNPALSDPWALACVDSRSNFLPDGTYSLTPVLDMINHDVSVKTSLRVEGRSEEANGSDQDAIVCLDTVDSLEIAPSPSAALSFSPLSWMDQLPFLGSKPSSSLEAAPRDDKEVCISYGDLTNLHTLLNYGFVVSSNPCNRETLTFRFIRGSPVVVTFQADGSPDEQGLGQLRQRLANTEETEILDTMPELEDTPLLFVSQRNEEEVYGFLAGELELVIDQAKDGAKKATSVKDQLVSAYLTGRSLTLQAALERIKKEFPQVLY
jgi:hypothetical protein